VFAELLDPADARRATDIVGLLLHHGLRAALAGGLAIDARLRAGPSSAGRSTTSTWWWRAFRRFRNRWRRRFSITTSIRMPPTEECCFN
jgi:hypothetical protein